MAIKVNEGAARWEIWLDDPYGNRLQLLDSAISWQVTRVANNIGAFDLVVPPTHDNLLRLDGMIEFWRAPAGKALKLVSVGFLRDFDYLDLSNGTEITVLSGPDGNDLLDRRIVAYAAGSAQAEQTDQADDLLKSIADENLAGDATDTDRSLETTLSFSVQGDAAAGPSITKGFSWKNALRVLREIAEDSAKQGTDLYFDVVPKLVSSTKISFEFRTYIGQIGRDRTGVDQVIFGKDWGNLANPSYREIYSKEVNYVYAGGQGEGADREIVEVEDTARSGASPWNRRESFVDARNEATTAGVTSKANTELNEGRPLKVFRGDLLDTPQAVYGIDWEFGDKVVVEYRGRQFTGPILAVTFEVSDKGRERISARLEVTS